jgi:plastocyanin
MDPMKSRRWIAAAALAAAVVFLVMVTGERGPVVPEAAPVSSSGAVLSSDGGSPPANGEANGDANGDANGNGEANGEEADRAEIIDALQGLLDALGISPEELAEGEEGTEGAEGANCPNGNGNGNGGAAQSGSDDDGAECGQSEAGGSATITITGFAFGQPVTVAPGATVEVVNTDAAPHNVTAADGSFETPDLNQDEKATFTAPTAPGRHEFTCTLHPEMTGTLIVEGGEADSSAGDRGDDKERTRSTEPNGESKRSDTGSGSGGDHDKAGQHEKATPGQENSSSHGSSNGY